MQSTDLSLLLEHPAEATHEISRVSWDLARPSNTCMTPNHLACKTSPSDAQGACCGGVDARGASISSTARPKTRKIGDGLSTGTPLASCTGGARCCRGRRGSLTASSSPPRSRCSSRPPPSTSPPTWPSQRWPSILGSSWRAEWPPWRCYPCWLCSPCRLLRGSP